jgi:hypothetical protein
MEHDESDVKPTLAAAGYLEETDPMAGRHRSQEPTYSRPDFLTRLKILTAAIDFLFSHPAILGPEFKLGIFILRQTILFGRFGDQMSHRQQMDGIRRLNRGTRISERRLIRACSQLAKIGFVTIVLHPGDWRGSEYQLNLPTIENYLESGGLRDSIDFRGRG